MHFNFKNPYNYKSKTAFFKYCEKLKSLPVKFTAGNFKYAWAVKDCKDYMIEILGYTERQTAFYFSSEKKVYFKDLLTFA